MEIPDLAMLTPSTEILSPEEQALVSPFFSNTDRSVVALKNMPEVIKGALFSRYSRSSKGVRRLFLDEFLGEQSLRIEEQSRLADSLESELRTGRERAESFYRRILSDYGDDSVGELGGAHVACQEVSQLSAKAIEDNRTGLSYLEKSSRYVAFDDRVDGHFRYFRPRRVLASGRRDGYIRALDGLFESYARHLPRMTEHLAAQYPIESLEFENALTGETLLYSEVRDEEMKRSANFAYRQAVRARACDVLRCFLPMATLTNVGVWGNGRALEYLLVKLYSDPLEENRLIAQAAHYELDQVIGPFLKRALDEKGLTSQAFLSSMREAQRKLAAEYVAPRDPSLQPKASLIRYDQDAIDHVVASILYPASNWPKREILARVQGMSPDEKGEIIRRYVGNRQNRRHKPGRAFERATYEFDLLLNIGEYRDLQRQRMVSPERQMFTTALGYEINREIQALPDVRASYVQGMELADELYRGMQVEMPFEAQYVVPFGYRVRYDVQLNLREAYHWIELRSSPQGHPDYRKTSQEMYLALKAVHPILVEGMKFVDMTPDVPMGRLRAEMRRARRARETSV